ncbi:hypothetical protein GGF31_006386 [Allomyces arbusculus]|nr:hypothetical protein GGF31_006386 [Allomyces arbusculus]
MSRQGSVPAPPPLNLEEVINFDGLVSDNYAAEVTHGAPPPAQYGPVALNDALAAATSLNYAFHAILMLTLLPSSHSAVSGTASSSSASPFDGYHGSAAAAAASHSNAFPTTNQPNISLPSANAPPILSSVGSFTTALDAVGPAGYADILSMPALVAPGASTGPVPPAANTLNAHCGIPTPILTQPAAGVYLDPITAVQFPNYLGPVAPLLPTAPLPFQAFPSAAAAPSATYARIAVARAMPDETFINPRNENSLDKWSSNLTKWVAVMPEPASTKKRAYGAKEPPEASPCVITVSVLLEGPDKLPLKRAPDRFLALAFEVKFQQKNGKSLSVTKVELGASAAKPVVELPITIPRVSPLQGQQQVHLEMKVTLVPTRGGPNIEVEALPEEILCESYRTYSRKKLKFGQTADSVVTSQMGDEAVPLPTGPVADPPGPVLADVSESEVNDLCSAIERLDPVAQIMDTLQSRRATTHTARVNVLTAAFCAHITVKSPGAATARPEVAWTAEDLGRVVAWVQNEDPAGPSVWTDTTILPLDFVARQCHDPAWLRAIFHPQLATPTAQAAHMAALRAALALPTADSWLPMHRAVFHDNAEFLIHAARIDMDHTIVPLRGGSGKTFLHLLAGRDDAAPVLRRLFADADLMPHDVWKQLLETGDSYGVTPLRAARYKAQNLGRLAVRSNVKALHEMEVAVGLLGMGMGESEEGAVKPST